MLYITSLCLSLVVINSFSFIDWGQRSCGEPLISEPAAESLSVYDSLVCIGSHGLLEGLPAGVCAVAEWLVDWVLLEVLGRSLQTQGLFGLRHILGGSLYKVYEALFSFLEDLAILLT